MKQIILKCKNKSDICRKFGIQSNGKGYKKVNELLEKYDIPYDIFDVKKKYEKNPKFCKNCGEKIPYDKKYNDFCNSSCSATYTNKKKNKRSKESRIKTSLSLKKFYKNEEGYNVVRKCLFCGNEFKVGRRISGILSKAKYCSNDCSKNGMKKNISKTKKEQVKNGTHKGWQSRNILSYPENFFIRVLKRNKIFDKCEVNYSIKKRYLGIDDDSNYFLDFYFKDKKIDLEIDGKQHKYKDRKESDNIRDNLLDDVGIKVYRIEWKSINNEEGKKYIKNEIIKFLEFYKMAL